MANAGTIRARVAKLGGNVPCVEDYSLVAVQRTHSQLPSVESSKNHFFPNAHTELRLGRIVATWRSRSSRSLWGFALGRYQLALKVAKIRWSWYL